MGNKKTTWRNTNVKSTRIDRATGQNKRVKCTQRKVTKLAPKRQNGAIVKKGRLAFKRAKKA